MHYGYDLWGEGGKWSPLQIHPKNNESQLFKLTFINKDFFFL